MKTNKTANQRVQEPVEIIDRLGMVSGFSVSYRETYVQAADRIERVWKGMHPIAISIQRAGGVDLMLDAELSRRGFRTFRV